MIDWLDNIFGIAVERREIPRPGGKSYYANSHTQIGCLHTTEGDTIEGAYATLAQNGDAPHFIAGEGRIIQCRPLTAQAAALHGGPPVFANANAALQIEMVARSSLRPWLPADGTLKAAVAIMAWASSNGLDIPLAVPCDAWLDDGSDCAMPWASDNARRRANLFAHAKGWYTHMEVPGQAPTWHWDCGALRRRDMISIAHALLDFDAPPEADRLQSQPTDLNAEASGPPAPAVVMALLRIGATGEQVSIMQKRLARLGYLRATEIDGDFGPHTQAALAEYQREVGVEADGVCGEETWGKLLR